MSSSISKQTHSTTTGSRTFYVSGAVLLGVALCQLWLALWAPRGKVSADSAPAEQAGPGEHFAEVDPVHLPEPEADAELEPDLAGDPTPGVPEMAPAVVPSVAEPPVVSLDVPLKDPALLEELERGMFLKEKGDLINALSHFRKAWQMLPDHPKLIFQLATTMDQLGLEGKSKAHWQSLMDLGKAAGEYQPLAAARLGKSASTSTPDLEAEKSAPAGPEEPTEPLEKGLMLVQGKVTQDKEDRSGERQIVSFSIQKRTPETVDVAKDVEIGVHFFELVNGRRIDRAALPQAVEFQCMEAPVDWADGQLEPVDAVYFQPQMSPQEILKYGQRKFYGYAIELRWQGRLQDILADPPDLRHFAKELPTAAPPEHRGSTVHRENTAGAEAALFPPGMP